MIKLSDLYSKVKNPLDSDRILTQIVLFYSKMDNTLFNKKEKLYEYLVKMNSKEDNSSINLEDKENLLVEIYNQWINNIINLNDKQSEWLKLNKGMDISQLQNYLKSFGKISSLDDIQQLKSDKLMEKKKYNWEIPDDERTHIKSRYISGMKEKVVPIQHRLYINYQNQDIWKMASIFKKKCESKQLPYYFKFSENSNRNDKMVIYTDTNHLGNYIEILKEIGQEYPEVLKRCGNPPVLTGKIDDWIGIGDEPILEINEKKQSYHSLRVNIIIKAMERIKKNQDFSEPIIDYDFLNKVRTEIMNLSKQYGIDKTFCFQKGTKEKFASMDSENSKKQKMLNDEEVEL